MQGDACPIPEQAEQLFTLGQQGSVVLLIDQDNLGINCHFFQADEIELDLDPRAIHTELRFQRLQTFMQVVGTELDKNIILTPENCPTIPMIGFNPQTKTFTYFPPSF